MESIDRTHIKNLAAQFYHALVNEAHNVFQHQNPDIQLMWPKFEYSSQHCCERCRQLDQVIMAWPSAAIRRFCPPWHLYCRCYISDSESESPSNLPAHCEGDDQYLCNPVDFLIAHGFIREFE